MRRGLRSVADNARYAKLRGQVGKVKFIVKETLYIASRHLCAFTRLEVVVDEIICCEKVVQILRRTLFWIGPNAKDVRIATAAMSCQPCLAEIRSNIRQKNVAVLESRYGSRRRYGRRRFNPAKVRSHIIGRHVVFCAYCRDRDSVSDL